VELWYAFGMDFIFSIGIDPAVQRKDRRALPAHAWNLCSARAEPIIIAAKPLLNFTLNSSLFTLQQQFINTKQKEQER